MELGQAAMSSYAMAPSAGVVPGNVLLSSSDTVSVIMVSLLIRLQGKKLF